MKIESKILTFENLFSTTYLILLVMSFLNHLSVNQL